MGEIFLNLPFKLDNIQKKIIFYILIITMPLFLLSLYFIQEYVGSELRKSAEKKAYSLNIQTLRSIESFLTQNSRFTKESAYMLKMNPAKYKTLLPFLKENVKNHKNVYGSALAIEPDSFLKRVYCKYLYKKDGKIVEKWLLPPKYNYTHKAWYRNAKETNKGVWSEPYFDIGGGEVYMSTFSFALKDMKNSFLGVITADIKLDDLSHEIQSIHSIHGAYLYLISNNGIVISEPKDKPLEKKFLHFFQISDNALHQIKDQSGRYSLYTMPVVQTSWIIGVMLKNSILYASLQQLKIRLLIIAIVGVLLILFMIMVISEQLKKDVAQKEKVKNELDLAMKIQKSFLPQEEYVARSRFFIDSYFKSAKEVGGDFYGYREYEKELVFYLGDVSGKGVPASLFMMATHILIESIMDTTTEPAQIMKKTNRQLCRASQRGMFATLIIGRYEFEKELLSFCIAGHPPFVIKAEGLSSPLVELFAPVGIFENIEYTNSYLELKVPFELMIYSDGVTEAENNKEEFFGVEKLSAVLHQEFSSKNIVAEIKRFVVNNAQSDDMTLLHISFFKSK